MGKEIKRERIVNLTLKRKAGTSGYCNSLLGQVRALLDKLLDLNKYLSMHERKYEIYYYFSIAIMICITLLIFVIMFLVIIDNYA